MSTNADRVNHPVHYTSHPSGIECIQITEHMGFNLGNAVKYIWRADEKGNAIEDLRKAAWYLNRELARRTVECSSCGGSGYLTTFGGIDLGSCTACDGAGRVAAETAVEAAWIVRNAVQTPECGNGIWSRHTTRLDALATLADIKSGRWRHSRYKMPEGGLVVVPAHEAFEQAPS